MFKRNLLTIERNSFNIRQNLLIVCKNAPTMCPGCLHLVANGDTLPSSSADSFETAIHRTISRIIKQMILWSISFLISKY